MIKNTSYPFEFPNVEKPYEVYTGSNVRLRYESEIESTSKSCVVTNCFLADISFVSPLFDASVISSER